MNKSSLAKNYLVALILAGGKSSRMGQDKALIPWKNMPMLERVYQVANKCTEKVYVITPWPEKYKSILPTKCEWLTELKSEGPLVALGQGLTQINSNWILLLGCDLPLLNSDIIETWIAQLNQLSPEILALVPKKYQGWEPLCGFYRQQIKIELENIIGRGDRSFQRLLAQIPVQPLSIDSQTAKMLFNCNTPLDLEVEKGIGNKA
ncbi:molybdopterin-guanine dinucleotide biosynthesis protein A [Trichodesmium erythraeum IMS101]|mgnify:CR=1 FL=1|uniref:Probable molybdenum cofactor guanylyltransferase n=1 Tax=Trichodesmium erythraeum (strain IMS101) TaxID=203124 RepID=Q116N9_TRIEI|nr:molybdenum cofactor guanylyltransferase [Trichodesmium erythraeum GBRTRLIN201]MCH2051308.1 molybdenum cofactor guanylyltransferase [Trichodesmium sp. ALOHA_ZT_67]MDE5094725.1 molybdenum cofactor guanylyltransferase [Trichodesmium sp. St11_bin5]MDT9340823.1 molybdenum cofactor guanylyltransferase [Trichodesmium erythraeum 21-75]